jgi:transposase
MAGQARIAQAFGLREDTARLWRSKFALGGFDARERIALGPAPLQAEAALRVAVPLFSARVADRQNWPLSRPAAEIARREGLSISRSKLCKVLRKGGQVPAATVQADGPSGPDAVDRIGLRLGPHKAQATAGKILRLFADQSAALSHPYHAQPWPNVAQTFA